MDDILEIVCGFLNRKGIDYVIVGGVVVLFHGIPRTTMDVDIVLQTEGLDVAGFVGFLKKNDFYASIDDMRDAFQEKSHCTVQDKQSMIRLDIQGMYNEMDHRTFMRRTDFVHKGTKIFIASPEDTIANKLVFGSEQDLKDAEGIYIRQMGKLDMKYLEEICEEMGVRNALAEMKERVEKFLEGEERRR